MIRCRHTHTHRGVGVDGLTLRAEYKMEAERHCSTHDFLYVLVSLCFLLRSSGSFSSSKVLLIRPEGKPPSLMPG